MKVVRMENTVTQGSILEVDTQVIMNAANCCDPQLLIAATHTLAMRSLQKGAVMCYCDKSENEILDHLKRSLVPDDALLRLCCWRKICQVREKRFNELDDRTWNALCDKRVALNAQQKPAG